MEISGKASPNKSIAAMPDVCLSPPSPPAGPIPIPYPNTAMASDTTNGSKTVKIKNKEVGLKNKSKYKKSNGNQPATNSFGAGVVSHKITGPCKFTAWSMDVKFEGSNVTRFGDLTTHNHMNPTNGGMTSSIAGLAIATTQEPDCGKLHEANEMARESMGESDDEVLVEVADSNTVITHFHYSEGPTVGRACSRKAVSNKDNTFSPGMDFDEKTNQTGDDGKIKSKVCDGDYKYKEGKGNNRGDHTHTESKILEDIFSDKPGSPPKPGEGATLVLAIDWPGPPKGKSTTDPCDNCARLICAASQCMNILICDENNEPQEPDCD